MREVKTLPGLDLKINRTTRGTVDGKRGCLFGIQTQYKYPTKTKKHFDWTPAAGSAKSSPG